MSRSVTTIKKHLTNDKICVIILAAGAGSRIKSSEPRSLLKFRKKTILENQIEAINKTFKNVEIIGVFGVGIERILKKDNKNIRIVENQLHEVSNNSESLRLGLNNTHAENVLFLHGDILFSENIFKNANFSNSFLIIDANNDLADKEVGVTVNKNEITTLSYGLKKKWCQICFLTGKELKILNSIFLKSGHKDKKMLSFEVINKIIDSGGSFQCHQNKNAHVLEIDCIKDIKNENIDL